MRRILLWLGKLTDFDRDGVKVLLVVGAINLFFIVGIAYDEWGKEAIFGPDCDSECQAKAEQILNDLFPDGLPTPAPYDVDKAIDDALRN